MHKLGSALAVVLLASGAVVAFLAPEARAAMLCSAESPHPGGLEASGVGLSGKDADDCVGLLAQKTGPGAVGPLEFKGSPSVANVNHAFADLYGGGTFALLYKADGTPQAGSCLEGLSFAITDVDFATAGSFALSWTGGTMAPAQAFDFVIGLKGATSAALYLFDDFLLNAMPGSADGTYTIAFRNPGGNIPALSNVTLFGRVGTAPTNISEPASLVLLATGLLGLAMRRRKRAV